MRSFLTSFSLFSGWVDSSPPTPVVSQRTYAPVSEPAHTSDPVKDLEVVRGKLEDIDRSMAGTIKDLRLRSELQRQLEANPDLKVRPDADMLSRVKLPSNIERYALNNDLPRELFAGVAYFLELTVGDDDKVKGPKGNDRTDTFSHICNYIGKRHNLSRNVFTIKRDNPDHPDICKKTDDGRVVTYVDDQHDYVVNRMDGFCTSAGADPDLGRLMIDWVASVNAGWQDQAINDQKGPFVNTQNPPLAYELRYPC